MECLGFEPGAAGWKAQTKPRSYGGHPPVQLLSPMIVKQICYVFVSGKIKIWWQRIDAFGLQKML